MVSRITAKLIGLVRRQPDQLFDPHCGELPWNGVESLINPILETTNSDYPCHVSDETLIVICKSLLQS